MNSIATLTMNPAIDKSVSVESVIPEKKLRCTFPRQDPGGGGLNVARAIHKLGGDSLALYVAGDLSGKLLQRLLDSESVRNRAIEVAGPTREDLHVYVQSTGQQYRFNMPGSPLIESEWRSVLDALSALNPFPAYLVASGSLPSGVPDDFYAQVVKIGRKHGSRVIVDASGQPLILAAKEGAWFLKPNFAELAQLAGCEIEDELHVRTGALKLIEQGNCEAVCVSLAAAGVILVTQEETTRISAPTVKAVSKVGAGDSMVAGTTLALSRGTCLVEAVRYGVAAGSAAVMRPGTQLCNKEDTERLYKIMCSR